VFAAHAKARPEVVPGPVSLPTAPTQMPLSLGADATELEVIDTLPARHPWAWLLQRVFAVDIMTCPRCHGPMRLVKIANKSDDIARVLADLGLGARHLRSRGQPPPRRSSSSPDVGTAPKPGRTPRHATGADAGASTTESRAIVGSRGSASPRSAVARTRYGRACCSTTAPGPRSASARVARASRQRARTCPTTATIRRLERGFSSPGLSTLYKLARGFRAVAGTPVRGARRRG
jgi:hypothetical protein